MMTRCILTVIAMVSASGLLQADEPAVPTTQPSVDRIRPILSPEAQRKAACERIDRFVAHVNASEAIAQSAKLAVTEAWKQERGGKEPEAFLAGVGIPIICEPFKTARAAMEQEKYAEADPTLRSLLEHKDPYVSLHAAALLARSLVEQDQLEEAEQVLVLLASLQKEKDLADKTFLEAEVDFLLGYCRLANLHYDEAQTTLGEFVWQHPGAPERLRLPAQQMLAELMVRQPGRLGEVSDLMTYSGRRLGHGEAGEPVQTKQEQAVVLLTALIKEAEEQEKQCPNCGGKGCKRCQGKACKQCGGKGCNACKGGAARGNQQPSSPANQSVLPGGTGTTGPLNRSMTARPDKMWGEMRDKDRERILQSLEKDFPARYRQLVEQYYKQLAKER